MRLAARCGCQLISLASPVAIRPGRRPLRGAATSGVLSEAENFWKPATTASDMPPVKGGCRPPEKGADFGNLLGRGLTPISHSIEADALLIMTTRSALGKGGQKKKR